MRLIGSVMVLALFQGGCESDNKSPNDDTPGALTPGDEDVVGGDHDDGGDDDPGGDGDGEGDGDGGGGDVDPCANNEFRVPSQEPEWLHIAEDGAAGGVIEYEQNPPASGPHYLTWARYQKHADPVPKANYVHNLEHGAVVILYHPDAPAEIRDALDQAWDEIPDYEPAGHKFVLMSPAPDLPFDFAIVAWHWRFTNACSADVDDIVDFVVRRRGHGREEDRYSDGTYPMRAPCNRWLNATDNQWTYVVPDGTDVAYGHIPPASGPHYEAFARYQEHSEEVPPEYWVGNLERGGVVMLYHPDADPDEIEKFRLTYEAVTDHWPCEHKMTLLTPSRDVPLEHPFYIVSWDAFMRADCIDEPWSFTGYANEMRFGREASVCEDGTYP